MEDRPIVSVANRLPVQRTTSGWTLARGGLVTAPRPVMESRDGVWVGWQADAKGFPSGCPTSASRCARRRAVRTMAQRVDRHDVHAWLDQQLSAIDS